MQVLTFTGIVLEEVCNKWIRRLGKQSCNSLIDGIFVLVQPAINIVTHSTSIMCYFKVIVDCTFTSDFGLGIFGMLAIMVVVQLLQEGHICCLWHNAFFFQNGKHSHGLKVQYRMIYHKVFLKK